MAAPTAAGERLLKAKITESVTGVWRAELELDSTTDATGQITISIDGEDFVGTVIRSTVDNGRVKALVAGGAGALTGDEDGATLVAKAYGSTSLDVILTDILLDTGETLSSTSDTLLSYRVPTWNRAAGPARRAIEALAKKTGLNWRILRDGTLWLGTDAFSAASLPKATEVNRDLSAGVFELRDAIALEPGTTWQGESIRQCVHTLDSSKTHTEAWIRSASGVFQQLREQQRREGDYDRIWGGQVVSQHADGTLEILLDGAEVRGSGIDNILIAPGLPGLKVGVPQGARCFVAYAGGDPSGARVVGWEHETAMTLLTVGSSASAEFVALANLVLDELNSIKSWADSVNSWIDLHTHPTGVGPTGTAATAPSPTMTQPSAVACTKLKAE